MAPEVTPSDLPDNLRTLLEIDGTAISWCDLTFNGWIGCSHHGPGCLHCYAEAQDARWGHDSWGPGKPRRLTKNPWHDARRWNAAAAAARCSLRVFASSMCDVFDAEAPEGARARLWDTIRATPWLDWLLLTKRTENIASMLPADWRSGWPNVWLGCSVVTQPEVDRMVTQLLASPARVHYLSQEPLLERVVIPPSLLSATGHGWQGKVSWLIVGGESGPKARPFDPAWAYDTVAQARATGAAPFVKQLGTVWAKQGLTLSRKADKPSDWPAALQVQHHPLPRRHAL